MPTPLSLKENFVLIRLSQIATGYSSSGFGGVKLGIGWCSDVTSNAEQGSESIEGIETSVETEGEFVEIGLQVLRADAVVNAA